VSLAWGDGAVRNGWLSVTVKPTARTALAAPVLFAFGNLVGEASGGSGTLRVNALDLGAVKADLNRAATLASAADVNRDGRVNALDLGVVKRNLNVSLAAPTVTAAAAGAGPLPAPVAPPLSIWEHQEVSATREILG
jgi:hypothetical protein